MDKVKKLKETMEEHLRIAKCRGFKDKTMRLTIEEIELIIKKLNS